MGRPGSETNKKYPMNTKNNPNNLIKKSCPGGAGANPGASKRKVEEDPFLLSLISPPARWSPFMVITSKGEKKVADLSVFVIHKALKGSVGETKSVSKLRSGDLLVECKMEAQASNLGKISSFGGIPVAVTAHKSLNSSRGVIRSPDLRGCSDEEMVKELDGVTHARRIYVRRGG